jgi:hypothetical protein
MFDLLFQAMFTFAFVAVFAIILITCVRSFQEWNNNNHSPKLEVEAGVVSKRTEVHHHHNNQGEGAMYTSTSTSYYVTFQVHSGDRMEFAVSGSQYGMIAEVDFGRLTFQGTRFLSFERS